MATSKTLWQRLRSIFRGNRAESELDAEMQFDLERRTEAHIAAGMNRADARNAALREFGSVGLAKEECRDARGTLWLDQLWQDLRFGVRSLRKNPGFTAVCVLTLALGIGANSAIFSVVNAVLLRPLPFPDSKRLVLICETTNPTCNLNTVGSYPDYADARAQSRSFSSMSAFTVRTLTVSTGEEAKLVIGVRATPNLFQTLGAQPAIGRTFFENEGEPGAPHVVILSDSFWKTNLAGSTDALGKNIRVDTGAGPDNYTVVGIMPEGFRFSPGEPEQIYVPLIRDTNRNHGYLSVVARLNAGVTLSQSNAEMNIIVRRLAAQYSKKPAKTGAAVSYLVDAVAGPIRAGLFIFLGVVALVLLIACSNVANLMLARGATRQKELAVRSALGASRVRLLRQVLTESILIALCGGAVGLVASNWCSKLLAASIAKKLPVPRIAGTHTDAWVMAFTFALSLLTGILFGIVPAFGAASTDVNDSLRENSRSASSGVRGHRTRAAFVIAETALALILLASAGVLLKSLFVMRTTAPGFSAENLLTLDFWIPKARFTADAQRINFFQNIMDRMNGAPGVRAAALVADLPLHGGSDGLGFHIIGKPDPEPGTQFQSAFNIVSANYFRTMGIPIRAGREFTSADSDATPNAIVVNSAAAKEFWSGENPLGKQIGIDIAGNKTVVLTIVGITGDVRESDLGEAPKSEIFLNYMQRAPDWPDLTVVIRTTGKPSDSASTIKAIAASVDPGVPVARVQTMDEVLSASLAEPSVYTWTLGIFASLALILAAVGLYGVVSYTAAQRSHEIGIRIALGAGRSSVLGLVLRQGLGLAAIGAAIGLLCAIGVNQLLIHIVPSVQPGDPLTLAAVAALLLSVAVAASYVPAWKATRIDPITALRNE